VKKSVEKDRREWEAVLHLYINGCNVNQVLDASELFNRSAFDAKHIF
jgi:hypothetical protein